MLFEIFLIKKNPRLVSNYLYGMIVTKSTIKSLIFVMYIKTNFI